MRFSSSSGGSLAATMARSIVLGVVKGVLRKDARQDRCRPCRLRDITVAARYDRKSADIDGRITQAGDARGRRLLAPIAGLTSQRGVACTPAMGNAISPRGDMPKNRVPLTGKDAPCPQSIPSPST